MHNAADRNRIAVNIWTSRVIPIVLAGAVGYATYVLVALLCVNYLLIKHGDRRAAIPILVVYFILFLFMSICFIRLVYITTSNPPYVPLGPAALLDRDNHKEKQKGALQQENGISAGEYDPETSRADGLETLAGTSNDPDSPGLELFYTKDIFECEMDGKPRWCSHCANWKPDRTHHCSSSGRCIAKMDHFCPWVGGPIGENNFKFFIQFTGYTALYCLHLLIVMAFYVHRQQITLDEKINSHFIAVLALAGFFGAFTAGMTGTSVDLAIRNQTQVENLGAKTRINTLAILVPQTREQVRINPQIESQPPYAQITYPLGTGLPPAPDRLQQDRWLPVPNSHTTPAEPPTTPLSSGPDQQLADMPRTLPSTTPHSPNPASVLLPLSACQNTEGPSELSPIRRFIQEDPIQEKLTKRDMQATRTFAIIKMLEPGDNPWDLGSARLNFETVMGVHVLDWFLPIKLSPCASHEDPESHYPIGPAVDHARAKSLLIPPSEIRAKGGRKRSEQLAPSNQNKTDQLGANGQLGYSLQLAEMNGHRAG